MPGAPDKVYGSAEEMIAGVSKETGVSPDQVRKVLRASFAGVKDLLLKELAELPEDGRGVKTQGQELSEAALEKVAGGIIIVGGISGLTAYARSFNLSSALVEKIASFQLWR
jgi:hypothetical protein